MISPDYYEDRRYCTHCAAYVAYLASPEHSFCSQCGARVRLFSAEDMVRFRGSYGSGTRSVRLDDERTTDLGDLWPRERGRRDGLGAR